MNKRVKQFQTILKPKRVVLGVIIILLLGSFYYIHNMLNDNKVTVVSTPWGPIGYEAFYDSSEGPAFACHAETLVECGYCEPEPEYVIFKYKCYKRSETGFFKPIYL